MKDKRYVMRTPLAPFDTPPYAELHDHIGNNVGNLVYIAGITRALMVTDGTEFLKTNKKFRYTDEEIAEVNETCDGFIISLADAIRPNYIKRLQTMTELMGRLKIPCVVIGCGLRAPYEPGSDMTMPFDSEVRDFFSAVLDHSAIVGVRGEITADYLKHLGFREERDYTVIGCPSMYMYGDSLSCRDTTASVLTDKDAPVSFNISPTLTPRTLDLISDFVSERPGAVYLPQNSRDEILMYYGHPLDDLGRPDGWPTNFGHPFYRDHDARFHNHPLSWIEFQKSRSLSLGTRLHGNITAVLAGTPALFLPQEARTRELCEYHGFAYASPDELEDITSLDKLIEAKDFTSPLRHQKRNFSHYLDFLKANGLANIFEDQACQDGRDEAPYDRRTAGYREMPALHPVLQEPVKVQRQRKKEWDAMHDPKQKARGIRRRLKSLFG